MRSLQYICEGILSGVDQDIEGWVEAMDRMKAGLRWLKSVKESDAPYLEAALFNVTQDAFRQAAGGSSEEHKHLLGAFMGAAILPYTCFNFDETENWEERQYDKVLNVAHIDIPNIMFNTDPNDYRWKWTGSNSFYHFFWDPDYTHSLDQEDLLREPKTQKFSKQFIKVAGDCGLKLKPIF